MGQKAFTLVELIIVIVLVGILAAISIVGYQSVVDRAEEASAKTSLQSADRELRAMMAFNTVGGVDPGFPSMSTPAGTVSLYHGPLNIELASYNVSLIDCDSSVFASAGDVIAYDVEGDATRDWQMTLSGSATQPAYDFKAFSGCVAP